MMPQQAKRQGNLRQSWRQAVVTLVAFAVCIQLFSSVQSSPVQFVVQSIPESRFYRDPAVGASGAFGYPSGNS